MSAIICFLLGIVARVILLVYLQLKDIDKTVYVQMNDLITCIKEQTETIKRLTNTLLKESEE